MSETARLLDDTVDRLLARRLDDPLARGRPDLGAQLLAEAVEAGLPLTLVPEGAGGFGGSLSDAATVAWRIGWHAAPMAPVPLLLLPVLDPGADPARTTLCDRTDLRLTDGGQPVGPEPVAAPAPAGAAQTLLALASGPDGAALLRLDARAARPFRGLDGAPWLRLQLAAALAPPRPSPLTLAEFAAQGALLQAAAMAGAMARVAGIVIDHANTRTQFGRPLGRFQAIQFLIAEAVGEMHVAEAALSEALRMQAAGRLRPLHWRSAKVQAGRAATIMARAAHQVLGAIGFTEEHLLHHYSRRLWSWRDDWGRESALEAAIGHDACADPRGLWAHLVDDAA